MAKAAAIVVAIALTLALSGCGREGPQFKTADVTGSAWGREFALTDHAGRARTLADFRGKAVVLFFGYTQCPDVCPTTLSTLAETMRRLGPDAARVQVLFAATLLPFVHGMSGWLYLVSAVALGAVFIAYAWQLWRDYSDALARRTFRYSILYLSLLFSAFLVDHYLSPWLF